MERMSYAIRLLTLFRLVYSLIEHMPVPDITRITHTCPNRAFTSSFADTYGQCLQYCWMTTGCSASTWVPRSSVCRLHEDGYSLPPPENTSCLFTEVSTSHLRKHHPCEGRPCDVGQTCVAVEAASNFICLPVSVAVFTSTTVPPASSTTTPAPTTTTSATPATTTTTTTSSTTTATTTTTTTTTTTSTTTTPVTTTATTSETSPTTVSTTSAQPHYRYMGCYQDDGQRMLDDVYVNSNVLTQEWCLAKCSEGNHKYAGLQHYSQCFCGDSYDESRYPKKAESECNKLCKGNPQQTCGGSWRMSLFKCR